MNDVAPTSSETAPPGWLLANAGKPSGGFTLDCGREVLDHERAALRDAGALLAGITENSAFAALSNTHRRWVAAFDVALAAVVANNAERRRHFTDELPASVNAVLSAFRAFTDQTDRWIIGHFSRNSPEHVAFKAQCAWEYDQNITYRLAANLRNVSQHRASVIAVRAETARNAESVIEHQLHVLMDRDAVDDKWQARVRREIAAIPDPVYITPILDGMVDSCERIQARLLILARPLALPAADLLITARTEMRALVADAAAPVLVRSDWSRLGIERMEPLSLMPIRCDLADLYISNVDQSLALLNEAE